MNNVQAREFDADGNVIKDIDFTDHNRPKEHTNPHQHRYIDNSTGGTKKEERRTFRFYITMIIGKKKDISFIDILSLIKCPEKYYWKIVWIYAFYYPSNLVYLEDKINSSKDMTLN